MSTSDKRQRGAELDHAAIGNEVARLAADVLSSLSQGGSIAPPHLVPSALNVGGGGMSPMSAHPPTPGFLQAPPLASAPLPKESDLRTAPAMLSELSGISSPVRLAELADPNVGLHHASSSTPYFLELAGMPREGRGPSADPTRHIMSGNVREFTETIERVPVTGGTSFIPGDPPYSVEYAGALPRADHPRILRTPPEPTTASPVGSGRTEIFDPHAVKRDFPVLSERVHQKPLIWLDNGATTQKPRAVIDRLSYFYEHENSNIHRAAHEMAARATDAYENAREKVRRYLNAPSKNEIVFLRGTTEAINLVAQTWGRRHIGAGDEILISWLEHHANIVPWQLLAKEKGAHLRVAPVDSRGQILLDEYERLLTPRTKLVAFTQVSNALGTIVPAKEMTDIAHRHGAKVLVDGAQAVSHMPVDVQDIGCDFYCFSGHKVFGPTGIGALFGRSDVLASMPPWQGGGNMIENVTFEQSTFQPPPGRFEAGTGNIADAVGLGAALDYVSALGISNVAR